MDCARQSRCVLRCRALGVAPGRLCRNSARLMQTTPHRFDGLTWDQRGFHALSVQATVQNGHVTLTGEVDWNYQREEAQRVARRVTGVRGITSAWL
ncbi:MAG: BON domain-containing protein [Vulcanimicrobiaceae bacterium]